MFLAVAWALLRAAAASRFTVAHESTWTCPRLCRECCQAENSFTWLGLARQDKTGFKCVLDLKVASSLGNGKWIDLDGRQCSTPEVRSSDALQAKTHCVFAAEEANAYKQLPPCRHAPEVQSYRHWSRGWCTQNMRLTGAVIRKMYFKVEDDITGGVCGMKGEEFEAAGLFQTMCQRACSTASSLSACWACKESAKADMCSFLQGELDQGRLDGFSMAVWAGAVGQLVNVTEVPKPLSQPRLMRKFKIPGWQARTVAFETVTEDFPIDLADGGFMCMMEMLQEAPLEDDMTHARNHYVTDLCEPGVGSQTGMAPRSAADVMQDYFDRYKVYQQPLHFDIPAEELLSDRALECMVFEAIGAHRLELVHEDGLPEGLNPMALALPVPPGVNHLLEVLPDKVRGQARFMVRMEGLFDDLPLRKSMARWGGNAFFSDTGTLLALQYNGETLVAGDRNDDEKSWDYLKFVFRSSLVSTVTAFDHLVSTHIIVSETLALAVAETLPPVHPLRLLLHPHVYKTAEINFKAANNLFPRNMIVHRASPYDDDAFEGEGGRTGLLWEKAASLKYRTFPELYGTYLKFSEQVKEMPELPFFEDGLLLYRALEQHVRRFSSQYGEPGSNECSEAVKADQLIDKFVGRFFELNDAATPDFWPPELRQASSDCKALERLLTECLFLVSGWHRHVGTVADFFRDTRVAGTSWKAGEREPRPKHALLMMLVAASTNANTPKLGGEIAEVFKEWKGVAGMPDFGQFSTELEEVQEEIVWRNEARLQAGRLGFHQMEPRFVDWGVVV